MGRWRTWRRDGIRSPLRDFTTLASLTMIVPVDSLLARAGGHPGAGRLRRALALYRPPPFTRSGLELRFLELVREAGVDVYETHGSREASPESQRPLRSRRGLGRKRSGLARRGC